jgi:hypothetical protein
VKLWSTVSFQAVLPSAGGVSLKTVPEKPLPPEEVVP